MTPHQVIVKRRHGVHADTALRSVDERLANIRLAKIVSNFGGDDWRERQSATLVVAWMSPRFRAMVGWRVVLFFQRFVVSVGDGVFPGGRPAVRIGVRRVLFYRLAEAS